MLLDVTLDELRVLVTGLSLLPSAKELHRRLAAHLHVQTISFHPTRQTRRVWWRSWKDGHEVSVEFYDEATCDRIDTLMRAATTRTETVATR
jgi:hypothetical protein